MESILPIYKSGRLNENMKRIKSNIYIRISAIISFLFIPFFSVWGNDHVKFYSLNEEFGISLRETTQICKDNHGFMWISSKMGIIRYTEDDIRTYQLPYESEDVISVRIVYMGGILYSYTNNGQIFRYNSILDKFESVVNISKELQTQFLSVDKVLVDGKGKIWVTSSRGFYCYAEKDGLKLIDKELVSSYIVWLDESHLFCAIDRGIIIFNTDDQSYEDYYLYQTGKKYSVSNMFYDEMEKSLWVGTYGNGLFCITGEKGNRRMENIPAIPNQPVLAIESNYDSTLLIGIDGQGIWKINKYRKQVLSVYKEDLDNPNSLSGNGVYDIYCDDNKRVWVCTYSGGVSFFDQENSKITEINHVVNNPNSLVNNDVNKVLEDSEGNLWFATNNGISYLNTSTNQWKSYYHNNKEQAQVFLSLCEDDKGRIWAGTYSSGVYLLDRKTGKELDQFSSKASAWKFNLNFVFDIFKDSQGNIWIGGVNGDLFCYLNRENRFISFKHITVTAINEYRPDQMLIGTTYGLLMLNSKTGNVSSLVEGYLVTDIFIKNDVIWLSTSGGGIVSYDIKVKTIKNFSVDAGLPSKFVNSIVFSNGYFWIGTERGLCRMNEDGNTILTFNSLSSLSNVSFNSNSHNTLKNGKLIWGTNNGALIFDPDEIQAEHPHGGNIFYQDLTISGRSIREFLMPKLKSPLDSLQELSLKYDQNTISLELIPIRVTFPGSKFSWKMEGLDKEWSKPVSNRILSYSNIPSGNYTLQIRMIDNSSTNVIDQRSIALHIIPPFWERSWFRILIFIFPIGLVFFLFNYYVDRLNKRHSEDKIRFFANTAHDIRTSLTLIKGPVEELNKESGLSSRGLHYLHLATEQTQRLLSVVTQLMDFQKVDVGKEELYLSMVDIVKTIENRIMMFESYAMSKNIELKFTSNTQEFVTAVDEVMIEKVIENLFSNAIKYSFPDKIVQIILQCNPNKWVLEVKDEGIGISKNAQKQLFSEYYRGENAVNSKIVGSGIGLLLVKNYVSLHEGKVSCNSQQNIGSTFQVTIPYKKTDEPVTVQNIPARLAQPFVHSKEINPILINPDHLATRARLKVLIVEDHDYLRGFLKSAMESEFKIYMAEDGQQAWKLIQELTPDLVVSDIMMPNMDGFELCKKLKSTYETSHIPIILLTSLTGKAQQLKGLGLGADDYLVKPFDVTLLLQRIKSIIQNREVIREKAMKMIKFNDSDAVLLDNELNDKFLKRIVEVVRENIENTNFSKDDFASAMNVSRSLLYKKIKSLTNQSPTDFIKTIRLNYGAELLHSRKYTVTEVSELCGFASVGYFSTVFKKYFGKSPTEIN